MARVSNQVLDRLLHCLEHPSKREEETHCIQHLFREKKTENPSDRRAKNRPCIDHFAQINPSLGDQYKNDRHDKAGNSSSQDTEDSFEKVHDCVSSIWSTTP